MPPLKQRRLDAAAESGEDTGQLDVDCELPQHRAAQEGTSESDKPLVAPGTKAEKKAGDDDAKAASESSAAAREVGPGATDVEMTAAGAIASKRAPAEPVRVEQEARPVEADEAAEIQGETSGSGDDMSVTTATLKRARDETEEMDKTSTTTSEEPPAKTPQGRRFTLRPEPKIPTDKRPADKTKQKNAGKQDGPGGG
ncbi:hypothetical protein HPB52_016008 [Rhipicephalus sanguineus]|uniref:Uncharacterized protein n=1 Tax=Rhipicephalus sanguineus TaxID=34632 RepID=A0A9D4Q0T6_RHISA|nr:hypothetical protein HPB52_016008 [Rhipicephalus sanguineus]